MVTDQLRAYVKKQLEKGIVPEAVKAALLKAGWAEKDAAEALAAVMPPAPAAPAAVPPAALPAVPSQPALPQEPALSAVPGSSQEGIISRKLITPGELTSPKSAPSASFSSPAANLQLPVEPASSSSVPSSVGTPATAGDVPSEIASINPAPADEKPAPKKSSPLVAALLVVFILGMGYFGYWFMTRKEMSPQAPVVAEGEKAPAPEPAPAAAPAATSTAVAVATTTVPAEDPDIAAARAVFEKIREANFKKDVVLEKQHLSKQTLTTLASSPSWKPIWYKDFEFVSAVKEEGNVVMEIISIKDNGATSTADTVFVKEADGWKLGIAETIQRIQLKKSVAATSTASTSTVR